MSEERVLAVVQRDEAREGGGRKAGRRGRERIWPGGRCERILPGGRCRGTRRRGGVREKVGAGGGVGMAAGIEVRIP